MRTSNIIKVSTLFLLFFTGKNLFAQNPVSLYYEPEFEVEFSGTDRWSHSFGIANRNLISAYQDGNKVASAEQEHFEINHFTGYDLGGNAEVALGLRYRFREAFEEKRHDEFRIIQQFGYKQPETYLNFNHRVRLEQRFRDEFIFRTRYRLGIARPLSEEYGVGLSTEFLYSMSEGYKPEAEQRFTLQVENSSIQDLEISAGIEYRLDNFNNSLEENIFFLTGATLSLN